jgi:hypothetical protein
LTQGHIKIPHPILGDYIPKLKSIAIAASFGLAILPMLPAFAAPIKDSTGALYVDSLTPSSRVTVEYGGAVKSISVNADACGILRVRNSSSTPLTGVTSIKINGTAKTVPTAVDTLPRCINGVLEVSVPNPFKTPSGDFVFPGFGALSQNTVQFPDIAASKQVSVNACGFTRITSSNDFPLAGILKVAGTSVDADKVAVGNPPICRNDVLYKAAP